MVLTRFYNWYGKRVTWGAIALILILAAAGIYLVVTRGDDEAPATSPAQKTVTIAKAGDLASKSTALRTVGTVRAVSEARLETESGGRITAVRANIGDYVTAGTVLASIENGSERASLLQAEGAYESALATNAGAQIGLTDDKVSAENAYRSAFATAEDSIRNLSDELFSNPTGPNPGVRVDAQGNAPRLSDERVALEQILQNWDNKVAAGISGDKIALLGEAERDLTRINTFVSTISGLVAEMDSNTEFTDATLSLYKTRFASTRSSLNGSLDNVNSTRSALLRAQQSTEGGKTSSESAARLKQALGTLRSAQSAYEKTLVRTPISGTVNALYLKANEYVGMSAPAAVIANNGALEITTAIGESERDLVSIGGSVRIDDSFDGTITRIAPAIDPLSGKIEVKISVDKQNEQTKKLENGTTVSIAIAANTETTDTTDAPLSVPLRSLKITPSGPVAFMVENGELREQKVVLGTITGESVVILEGLTYNSLIVTDARGLKNGEKVTIAE